jgi:prepilin-type N-terminal cleavage/methylation domain-containing protein
MNSKLKAFTLMELIVGMIISSIVIAMAATGFRIVKVQFMEYKKTNDRIQQWTTLEYLLSKDAAECDRLERVNKNSFVARYPLDEITYRGMKNAVLRTQANMTDTFNIGPSEMEMHLFNDRALTENGLIYKLGLKMKTSGESQVYYLTKQYSAQTLMSEETMKTLSSY